VTNTNAWTAVIEEAERHLHTAKPVYFLLEKPERGRRRQKLYSATYDHNTERLECDAPDNVPVVLAAIAVQVGYEPIGFNLPGEIDDDDEDDTEPLYEPYYGAFRLPSCPDWAWNGVWIPEALRSRMGLPNFGMVGDDYQPTEPRFIEALRCVEAYVAERCAAIWQDAGETHRIAKEEAGRALNRGVPAHISRDELISEGDAAIAAGNKATRLAARSAITDLLRSEQRQRGHQNDASDALSDARRRQKVDASVPDIDIASYASVDRDDGGEYFRERLRLAAEELPERQREAVRLVYFDGRSQADAAAVLGCSQPAVAKLLAVAFEAIRAKVGKPKH
jgi:RNA polymerase sigma factor (sigma-70 family)